MTAPRLALALATFALAGPASSAAAQAGDGTAEYGTYGGAGYGEYPQDAEPEEERRERPSSDDPPEQTDNPDPQTPDDDGGRPVLSSFEVSTSRLYLYGRAARVTFRIDDEAELVAVGLYLSRPGSSAAVRAIDLGMQSTGETHVYRLTGREGAALPEGPYEVRVTARDPAGKTLLAMPRASAVDGLSFHWHRFPLRGTFSYGGADARFGAKRNGHTHQGQDLIAAEGTPVLAPRGGVVTKVDFQEGGAGHYVVVAGAGEKDNYVFMHLQAGSITVREGQRVRTGRRLGNVGNTGASSGAHLHFEIWDGTWYGDGEPFDPYPLLQRWDRWS
jgi:murein DD-endopeptidase MepM/ murein hydrolase activator NlpD